MVSKFGTGVDIDNISDEFAGQGHRSGSWGPKTLFSGFSDVSEQISSLGLWCDVMTSHDVIWSGRDIIWRHCMMSWRHITREVQHHFSVFFWHAKLQYPYRSASNLIAKLLHTCIWAKKLVCISYWMQLYYTAIIMWLITRRKTQCFTASGLLWNVNLSCQASQYRIDLIH